MINISNLKILIIGNLFFLTINSFAAPPKFEIPTDNPMTTDKIELGKKLYFDPRLSKNGTISCASCHNVMLGGEDNRAISVGVNGQLGTRSSPTVWNIAFQSAQFWDGRAPNLEEQAKGPLTNPVEMGMPSLDAVVARVKEIPEYIQLFEKSFKSKDAVNIENIVKAIATYERTLIAMNSPYDKFISGNKKAMSELAQKGFENFKSVGCITCHTGTNFSGPNLPMGTPFLQKFPIYENSDLEKKYKFTADGGRFQGTKKPEDKNFYRVATLRNIALTAPYFHNGAVNDLNEAVRVMAKLQLNRDLKDEEVKSIVSFLEALTGEFPKQTMPRLPVTVGKSLVE